jgi:hypothetical protein
VYWLGVYDTGRVIVSVHCCQELATEPESKYNCTSSLQVVEKMESNSLERSIIRTVSIISLGFMLDSSGNDRSKSYAESGRGTEDNGGCRLENLERDLDEAIKAGSVELKVRPDNQVVVKGFACGRETGCHDQ